MWSFRFIMERVSLIVDPIVSLKIRRIAHGFAWWDFQFYATQWCKTSTDRLCKVGWRVVFTNVIARGLVSCIVPREILLGILSVRFSFHAIVRFSIRHKTPIWEVFHKLVIIDRRVKSFLNSFQQLRSDSLCVSRKINGFKVDPMALNIYPFVKHFTNRRMKKHPFRM